MTTLTTAPARRIRAPGVPGAGPVRDVPYGTVLGPDRLAAGPMPAPRGPLTAYLAAHLHRDVHELTGAPDPDDDVLYGDDGAVALYCLYELHYRGFAGVDDEWEWEPSVIALRRRLERSLAARLREEAGPADEPAGPDVAAGLERVIAAGGGRSLSRHLAADGTVDEFREYAVHRSLLQLKEADPHTWAVPRLAGAPKAALVEIQADEYGQGVERDMHQNLFGLTMLALGLDPAQGAYLDAVPGPTFATVNLPSYFGLNRRWRAALVGHLAVFEMTSVEPMGAYAAALRRLGLGPGARHFYEVHVVADAHHQTVAARDLAAGLVAQDPALAADVLFGARATMAVEGYCSEALLDAWDRGESSLRPA